MCDNQNVRCRCACTTMICMKVGRSASQALPTQAHYASQQARCFWVLDMLKITGNQDHCVRTRTRRPCSSCQHVLCSTHAPPYFCSSMAEPLAPCSASGADASPCRLLLYRGASMQAAQYLQCDRVTQALARRLAARLLQPTVWQADQTANEVGIRMCLLSHSVLHRWHASSRRVTERLHAPRDGQSSQRNGLEITYA